MDQTDDGIHADGKNHCTASWIWLVVAEIATRGKKKKKKKKKKNARFFFFFFFFFFLIVVFVFSFTMAMVTAGTWNGFNLLLTVVLSCICTLTFYFGYISRVKL